MDTTTTDKSAPVEDEPKVPESPKPLAFTVDFGDGKSVDTQRHKSLVEKFQRKHKRGQSMSKLEESTPKPKSGNTTTKHPLTGNLPRKSSFQSSEGYFSSDEKSERGAIKNGRCNNNLLAKRSELSLPLRNVVIPDKMSQSFPNAAAIFNSINTPDIELKDVSSPELDLISPFSPTEKCGGRISKDISLRRQFSSPESELTNSSNENGAVPVAATSFFDADGNFIEDLDRSDAVSDAGTYTLDADNYSEEQKARMSIDSKFKIEQVSVLRKTEEYIKSLGTCTPENDVAVIDHLEELRVSPLIPVVQSVPEPPVFKSFAHHKLNKMLSPILSPTQNLSITQQQPQDSAEGCAQNVVVMNNGESGNKTFNKIMFPSPKARNRNGLEQRADQGSVISVTSSGAFRTKSENDTSNRRKLSLTKSEVHVEAYVDNKIVQSPEATAPKPKNISPVKKLTASIVDVQNISMTRSEHGSDSAFNDGQPKVMTGSLVLGKVSNLPVSPTKIPSPIHTISRPRSRNGIAALNADLLSDSSLETESYLKPTQNFINSLQQRLSLDSDEQESSDYDGGNKYGLLNLNNSSRNNLLKHRTHMRHNSLDDRTMKISNKLEHFQNKNLQGIDQTYAMFNQYHRPVHKIQNSPNNSPIRRSSSFSTTKNQVLPAKITNVAQKECNLRNSPSAIARNGGGGGPIQRSASTASIKPTYLHQYQRRSSITKIDRNQFGDTESSSEEDFDKSLAAKKKDLSNLTTTRYNRAFSLRRGRLEAEATPPPPPRCPNTPEMRRKFNAMDHHQNHQRAMSMDRRPVARTNDIQSRYLLNVTKKGAPVVVAGGKLEAVVGGGVKSAAKGVGGVVKGSGAVGGKPQQQAAVFARTDSGRFSMRGGKPPVSGAQKSAKKDPSGKKSSGRSNSSLSSREKEFQNWKRRKSYDPMKAAAEGKKKEIAKKQNVMTQSFSEANQSLDCDSSPSHSSSVHRSQSFHGTAALGQLISSEEEEDLTLSADEGFSPPTPSPCELSPMRATLRNAWKDHVLH